MGTRSDRGDGRPAPIDLAAVIPMSARDQAIKKGINKASRMSPSPVSKHLAFLPSHRVSYPEPGRAG